MSSDAGQDGAQEAQSAVSAPPAQSGRVCHVGRGSLSA